MSRNYVVSSFVPNLHQCRRRAFFKETNEGTVGQSTEWCEKYISDAVLKLQIHWLSDLWGGMYFSTTSRTQFADNWWSILYTLPFSPKSGLGTANNLKFSQNNEHMKIDLKARLYSQYIQHSSRWIYLDLLYTRGWTDGSFHIRE